MPKDNENVPLPHWTTDDPRDPLPSPFAPSEMVRCEECLRANPPTRLNCLYCAATLPLNEATITLQKPTLRPLEKWERGYNNILLRPAANLSETSLANVSELLRLRSEDLARILASTVPLPLARAASIDEAQVVQQRLANVGIDSSIVPDAQVGVDEIIRVRALDVADEGIYAYQTPEAPAIHVPWAEVVLFVTGRLVSRRVELKEQKGTRENRITDASEFATDEMAFDFYSREEQAPYRIAAHGFDFSCLGKEKGLLATENLSRLLSLLRARSPGAAYDESFNSAKKALEAVWPSMQKNASTGWRRERPGKYSIGTITELSNEMQFLRYSQLRRHFLTEALMRTNPDE